MGCTIVLRCPMPLELWDAEVSLGAAAKALDAVSEGSYPLDQDVPTSSA